MPAETPSAVSVLLVDDDPEDFELTRDLVDTLDDGRFHLEWARTFEQGISELRRGQHQICLLDYRLGEQNGLEFLQQALNEGCTLPIILLTGQGSGSIEKDALAAGAADYLIKRQLDAESLWRALRHALQRARATEVSRERDRLYRALFDGARDAMLIVDDDCRYVDANPAALALTGLSREQFKLAELHTLVPGLNAEKAKAKWEQFVERGSSHGKLQLQPTAGELRIAEYHGTANILPNRHLFILRDVTERSRVEASQMRLAAIVESAEDAIVSKNLDGTILEWNSGAERLYGCPASEAVGRSCLEFVPPERQDEWRTIQRNLEQGHGVRAHETVLQRKDGRLLEVSVTASPLRNASGRVVGSCTITRDISETRKLQSRLAISDRMASVGTLAAGVAHEINNPLAAVIANIESANREATGIRKKLGESPELMELSEALRDASDSAQRVRQIVRDLKLFSRSDDERRGPVDVNRVMESTLRMVWNEIRHRARLIKHLGENLPTVDANESRLGQVFLNLLVNAAQAIPEGNAENNEIHITTRATETGVEIDIRDSGCGIPPDKLARIFEPFYTTKPIGQGTGLGLSICHGIIASLHGEISVESQPGSGTLFRISLPIGVLEELDAPLPAALLCDAAPSKRGRILIVDDDPMILRAASRTLGREHDVTTVSDPRQVPGLLETGLAFDLILCDVMMPQVTGMDLYSQLHDMAPNVAASVIFVTGGPFTPRARAFLEQVPNVRIEKPFDPDALSALVRDRLR